MKTCLVLVWITVVSGFLGGCEKRATMDEVRPYPCSRTPTAIIIDGVLGEAGWKEAELIDTFYSYDRENRTTLPVTRARLTWDSDFLYIGIECRDDDIWSYSDNPDAELWLGDVVEVFIKPAKSVPAYCEFVIAPNGNLFDARYPSRGAGGFRRFKGWDSHARVATEVDGSDGDWSDCDRGFTVEMAIPISAFREITEPPSSGTSWTFGVFRYDYSKNYEKKLLLMSVPDPGKEGFHSYEGYRQLDFR